MSKCLVTKMKGSVNNSSLKYYNGITVHVLSLENAGLSSYSANDYRLEVLGIEKVLVRDGGSISVDGSTVTSSIDISPTSAHYIVFSAGDYDVILIGKYSVRTLKRNANENGLGYIVNIADIEWAEDISEIRLKRVSGVLNFKRITSCYLFDIGASNYSGNNDSINIDDFAVCENLEYLVVPSSNNHIGSVESLGICTQLRFLNLYSCASITGEITNMLAAMVSNGRDSGTIEIQCVGSQITEQGNRITYSYLISKGGSGWVLFADFSPSYENGYRIRYTS